MKNLKSINNVVYNFLLFIIIIFSSLNGQAQNDAVRQELDHFFAPIDKSQIFTKLLKEYGYQFVNVANYNGVLADSNIVDANALRMLYASLLSGNVQGAPVEAKQQPAENILLQIDNSQLPTFQQLNSNMYTALQSSEGVNPVTMMMVKYNNINPTAIEDGLFTINNNQLYDVANRPGNPYIIQTAFAAAQQSNECNTGTVNLLFKPELFFTNVKYVTVSSIQVNFDDGNGFVTAGFGTIASATYTSIGEKRLTYSITLSNGQNFKCYSRLFVNYVPPANTANRYANTTMPTLVIAATNQHSGGDVFVQYSINNTSPVGNRIFRRPLIVLEGFDIHDAAPLLVTEGYNYSDFWRQITSFNSAFNGRFFNDNLDDVAGYDLIFINYRNGTDDIKRNAALLQEVITWVNNNKDAASEQNVVLGISMGGLVARYCLAKMTKENNNPQTRLLVTHDSPHRGANIPLSAQYLLSDISGVKLRIYPFPSNVTLGEVIPALREYNNLRTRPATQQQVMALVTANGLVQNTFLNGEYRDMITFSGTVQPAYQFVATSQGSQCGTPLFQPYSLLANGGGTGSVSAPLLGLFGTQAASIDLQLHALPNFGEVQNIAHVKVTMSLSILLWTNTKTLLEYDKYSSGNMFPWDGVAGGTTILSKQNGLPAGSPPGGNAYNFLDLFNYNYRFNGLQIQNAFTFVPIVSALDVENINAFDQPYIFANNGQNGSRAIHYMAQERQFVPNGQITNIKHTEFTGRNANFIFNEMELQGNGGLCCQAPNECQAYTPGNMSMTGVNVICNSANYSIANLPANSVVQWSVVDGNGTVFLLNPGGVNGSILTITNLHTQNLATTLVASIVTPQAGPIFITKQIFADNDNGTYNHHQAGCWPFSGHDGNISVGQSKAMNICNWMRVYVGDLAAAGKTLSLSSSIGAVNWYYDGNLNIHFDPSSVYATFTITGQPGSCSQGSFTFYSVGIHRMEFTINPNPVSDVVTITATPNPNNKQTDIGIADNLQFTIRLKDFYTGMLLRTENSKKGSKQQRMNMSGLMAGYYILEITEGDQVQTFKVLKQ
jgi:hypothetical protein